MTKDRLEVFLIKGVIDSYKVALEALKSPDITVLSGIKCFNFHVRGHGNQSNRGSEVTLIRELGSSPALYVSTNGFTSSVRLTNGRASIIAILHMDEDPENNMICFLSDCDVVAVDVNVTQEVGPINEMIPVQGMNGFPWKRVKEVL